MKTLFDASKPFNSEEFTYFLVFELRKITPEFDFLKHTHTLRNNIGLLSLKQLDMIIAELLSNKNISKTLKSPDENVSRRSCEILNLVQAVINDRNANQIRDKRFNPNEFSYFLVFELRKITPEFDFLKHTHTLRNNIALFSLRQLEQIAHVVSKLIVKNKLKLNDNNLLQKYMEILNLVQAVINDRKARENAS